MFGRLGPFLRSSSGRLDRSARLLHGPQDRRGPPAFAFDIDGVLVKGGEILEPAKKALGVLYNNKGNDAASSSNVFVLFASMLTNGKVRHSMLAQQADTACVAQDRPQFPVCFMTNGGGVTEAEKAEQLSEWLNVTVHADQVGT